MRRSPRLFLLLSCLSLAAMLAGAFLDLIRPWPWPWSLADWAACCSFLFCWGSPWQSGVHTVAGPFRPGLGPIPKSISAAVPGVAPF